MAIIPTVGRKVWFYTNGDQDEPHDATVVRVFGRQPDSLVNLHVSDPQSAAVAFEHQVAVGDEYTPGRHYRWMPYQQAQAAKA